MDNNYVINNHFWNILQEHDMENVENPSFKFWIESNLI